MANNKTKNTISLVVLGILMVFCGEGILVMGLYWPIVWSLINWNGVFWYVLFLGVLLSGLTSIALGKVVLVMLLLALFMYKAKEVVGGTKMMELLLILIANIVTDLVLGLKWSIGEWVLVALTFYLVKRWQEYNSEVVVKYGV